MKKIYIITIVVAIIGLIVILAFFSKRRSVEQVGIIKPQVIKNDVDFMTKIDKNFVVLADLKEYVLKYFSLDSQEFSKIFTFSDKPFAILFSPTRDEAIVWHQDQSGGLAPFWYDFKNGSKKEIDKNYENIVWSPDGKTIVYQYYNIQTGLVDMSIANHDGGNWHRLVKLDFSNVGFYWVKKDEILLYHKLSEIGTTNLYRYSFDTRKIETEIIIDNFSGKLLFAPDGFQFLYEKFFSNSQGYKIFLRNVDSADEKDIQLSTSIEKIVFSSDGQTIFAAVREGQNDVFYRIDLSTLKKTKYTPSGDSVVDAKNLVISEDQSKIYFISANILYSLDFKTE